MSVDPRKKRKLKLTPINSLQEGVEQVDKHTPALRKLFHNNSIPVDAQDKILYILLSLSTHYFAEKRAILSKLQRRKRSQIDFTKLRELIVILLSNEDGHSDSVSKEDMDSCLGIIDAAIVKWQDWDGWVKFQDNLAKRRSVLKLKHNPKDLKAFTVLIRRLVKIINPLFRHRLKDRWKRRSLKKEDTFGLVSDILNYTFPHLRFTKEQVKARFYKE